MTPIIEISGLRKEYRHLRRGPTTAVAGLDLEVPEGGVFGFLGPNGSGKTTTIRCLLGLVRASAGHMTVLGRPMPRALPMVMPQVGAIVETPALVPSMTARENLRLLGAVDRIGPARVNAVLDQVGLSDRAGDKVRGYSLGMRQRLGLAAALLKDPAVLVLDEPANGLDPAGIREIRELLRALGREGRTVFVSSHQLSEVEQTCDRVAIIDRGRCILTGAVHEVLAAAARPTLLVGIDDLVAGAQRLIGAGFAVESTDAPLLRVSSPAHEAARVTKTLADAGLYVTELRPESVSLEELFLDLTGRVPEEVAGVSFVRLTVVEMRHALHRRLVRWMIAIAVLGCAVMGVIAFLSSGDPLELARADEHPAILSDWWVRGTGEGFLLVAAIYLAIGAAICGASVAGAEWKWGTVTTMLTWEPRRGRLHLARTTSAGVLAFVIGLALQVLFFAAALPAILAHGTTDGVDGDWWIALGAAMVRIAFMTALVAVLALNVATIGRNTAAALVALSVWMIALEGLVRGLRPGLARFLVTENVVVLVPWRALDNVEFHRTPALALVTVVVYLAAIVGATTLLFARRDVAAA